MSAKLTDEQRQRLRESILRTEEQIYSQDNFRQWRRFLLGTIAAALLWVVMEFGSYLPFVSNDGYTLRTCTLTGTRYSSGRSMEVYSIYEDGQGGRYEIVASLKDYPGRQIELYTMLGTAHRTHYEVPRTIIIHILVDAVLVFLFAGEIWWYVKYREYQSWIESTKKLVGDKK